MIHLYWFCCLIDKKGKKMSTTFYKQDIVVREKLPIGIQVFEKMRTQGYLYVDKTRDIYNMVTQGMFYFLSRPRRFGKSLLVSTLKCLFQGEKKFFEGLWIAEHGEWEWGKHPVILIDFSEINNVTPEQLHSDLEAYLTSIAEQYEVHLGTTPSLMSTFRELILSLSQKTGKSVTILIDEYDKPIIDHLGKGKTEFEIAKVNRDLLKSFFGVLKGGTIAPVLRFILLTGISRFSKVSLFSELNNLDDISMNSRYAGLLGYTQEELENRFAEHIEDFAKALGWPNEQILVKLREQYNGYRFSEDELRIYNPFSILKAFSERKFGSYWFQTGTPTFLINLLKQTNYNLPKIEGLQVSQTIFDTFDIERLRPEALLFQTGYLTISDVQHRLYTLDYPNQEVKSALTESLLFSFTAEAEQEISSHVLQLSTYLETEDFDAFFETLTAIFASIPYDIETKRDEGYFHTLFYLMMTASGTDARSSILTCRGRIDLAVIFPEKVYIIEFKCNQSAETAIQQIHDKSYTDQYRCSGKQIILMGINFSTEQRNLAGWKVEKLETYHRR